MDDILTSLTNNRDKFRYECSFVARTSGALGKTYPITEVVEMDESTSDEEITLKLYEKYELFQGGVTIKKKWHCHYNNCQDRNRSLCALCYE